MDNTERIAQIEDILRSGVKQATVRGETVVYDLSSLRRELANLKATDDHHVTRGYRRRPKMARIRID